LLQKLPNRVIVTEIT